MQGLGRRVLGPGDCLNCNIEAGVNMTRWRGLLQHETLHVHQHTRTHHMAPDSTTYVQVPNSQSGCATTAPLHGSRHARYTTKDFGCMLQPLLAAAADGVTPPPRQPPPYKYQSPTTRYLRRAAFISEMRSHEKLMDSFVWVPMIRILSLATCQKTLI